MKQAISVILLFGFVSALSASTFTCYRYVNGHPTGGWIKVKASSKSEANYKAMAKFKKLGGTVHSVRCKY